MSSVYNDCKMSINVHAHAGEESCVKEARGKKSFRLLHQVPVEGSSQDTNSKEVRKKDILDPDLSGYCDH
ncbi:hypothetical protein V1478_012622 [Vespula squamosa]|uniref:Uncharacterized protein n=1 Tax=Vespula squamosa TaxID=30214 RepID=A0ABD2A8P0_VESSQ